MGLRTSILLVWTISATVPMFGEDVRLSWNPNTESDLAGYKVYYGTAPRSYGSPTDIGDQTSHTVAGLSAGTYYFAVTAYDLAGNESQFSTEVFKSIAGVPGPPPPEGGELVAAYALDDGGGSSSADASGNGNHGTLSGPDWAGGRYGMMLAFDGVDDYVEVPNSPSLDISGSSITVSAWVQISDAGVGKDAVILAKLWSPDSQSQPTPYQYAVEFDGNGSRTFDFYFGSSSGTLRGPYSVSPPTGVWTHMAFTYDGTSVRGYLDGSERISTPVSGSIAARGNSLRIGIDGRLTQPFLGGIDEVRIYNRALTLAEIQQDMNTPIAQLPPPGPAPGSGCDLNSDGSTNAVDIQSLVNAILALDGSSAYDLNRDGSVNAVDLQALANTVLGVANCP